MLWLSYPFTKMLSSLASFFPMISPRAESIAPGGMPLTNSG